MDKQDTDLVWLEEKADGGSAGSLREITEYAPVGRNLEAERRILERMASIREQEEKAKATLSWARALGFNTVRQLERALAREKKDRPRKPAPAHRSELLQKKATAQDWAGR